MERPSERRNRPGFGVSSSFVPLEGHHQWWAAEGWGFDMEIASKLSQTYFFQGINSYKFQISNHNLKKKLTIFFHIYIYFHHFLPKKISDSGSDRFSTSRSESRVLVFSPRENGEGRPDSTEALAYVHSKGLDPGIRIFRIHPQDGWNHLKT